jgi:predicted amidohydrolase
MKTALRISLVQIDIAWENKQENLRRLEVKLRALSGKTDLVVLPEMFSTGFTMQSHLFAETINGETLTTLRKWSKEYNIALTGSFICLEEEKFFNRAFFLSPEGLEYFYDKRHLFRMGNEPQHFSAGDQRCIFSWQGWKICLMICYDLRFPVWCRNVINEYDLLVFVANWPTPRNRAWDTLLCARAIENQSYVCGVNRVGVDGMGIHYSGNSALYNMKGENLINFAKDEEGIRTINIDLDSLRSFRTKFPAWRDADFFSL